MLIYKVADATAWRAALAVGDYHGSADDIRDGFIHFSTAEQTPGTLAKHFARRTDLIIAAVAPAALGDALKWEASRAGALFPHLYQPLAITAVNWWQPLVLGTDGIHILPTEVA